MSTEGYIERAKAALEMELSISTDDFGDEEYDNWLRHVAESVLEASGALEAVFRLEGLDK